MKKYLSALLALTLLTASAFAQSVAPTPNASLAPVEQTPRPKTNAGPVGQSTSLTQHFVVPLNLITATAAATGDVKLFTTATDGENGKASNGIVIEEVIIWPETALTGGSTLSATAVVMTANKTYGTARAVSSPTGKYVTYVETTGAVTEPSATVVNLRLVTQATTLSALTAGKIHVWVKFKDLD